MSNYDLIETSGVPIKAWTRGVGVEDAARRQLENVARLPIVFHHVAVMPDVHYGIGATVGSVVPTENAVIPAAVGVDIGCFTGDTKIPLADGTERRLDELAAADEELVVVYACSPTGRVVFAKARAMRTRESADLVRVTLDNGQDIRCTPDHEFMRRDGTYVRADEMIEGESLMPLYRTQDRDGYTLVQQNYSGRMQKAHWIVARSGLLGPVPRFDGQRTVIHHRDFNAANNDPKNLEFMGDNDHSRYHRLLVERNEHWQSPEFEAKRVDALARKASTAEGHAYFAARGTQNIVRYMTERREHFEAAVAGNGERGREHLVTYNTSEQGRATSRKLANQLHSCELCGEQVRSYIGLHNHRKWKHGFNHKVVRVEQLAKREPVFCLSVPGYNNFALTAGVFVHNCGMMAVETTLDAKQLPDSLKDLRSKIERAVPHGRTSNGGRGDRGAWSKVPTAAGKQWKDHLDKTFKEIVDKHPRIGGGNDVNHLGTLGGGNHFIEVCLDERDKVWFMLHSGSRGVGNRIGSYFINLAKEDMRKHMKNLPDADLAYLREGTSHFDDYVQAVEWGQKFALTNRKLMMDAVLGAARSELPPFELGEYAVNCHHNYVAREHHFGKDVFVTRKGAVRAKLGDLGIIPGSMGARSFIVRGKGNADSFHSCSHGAGRTMSRGEAKRKFTVDDHIKATEGIECKKDASVIDETPMAYKPIEKVMAAQADLVDIVHELRQVVVVKG